MPTNDTTETSGLRMAAVCGVFAAIVFAAGYLLGKQRHQTVELPLYPLPKPVENRVPRFVQEGILGYPLGTVIDVSGQIYIDGAGFPLDRDRMQISSVNGKPLYRDIFITGGDLPENGPVHFRGYEAIEKQPSYKRGAGKPVPDAERPWLFERRFVVLETLAADQTESPLMP